MRKARKYVVVGAAFAVGALLVAAVAYAAETVSGGVKQTFEASVPSKLPKKGFKNVKLKTSVSGCFVQPGTNVCDETREPFPNPEAKRVIISLDRRNIELNPDSVPVCKIKGSAKQQQSALSNLPPDQAVQACGKGSKVGSGSANAQAGQAQIPATVTAFNGRPQRGNGTLLLHAFSTAANQGTVPIGTINEKRNTIDIKVPTLLGGNARLRNFSVRIGKKKYIQANCSDSTITFGSKWTYSDAPGLSVKDSQSCTVG